LTCIEALFGFAWMMPLMEPALRELLPESSTSAVIRTAALPRFCTVTKILFRPRLPPCVACGTHKLQPMAMSPAESRVGPSHL